MRKQERFERYHLSDEEMELPAWAREKLAHDRDMGQLSTSGGVAQAAGFSLILGLEIGLFVVFCVVVFLVGRCVVG